MDKIDNLDNDEKLYRWIILNELNEKTPPHYIEEPSGEIDIQPEAFLGGERLSVDIARINCFKPEKTKRYPTDGIICFTVKDVRSISIRDYTTNVEHEPLPNNKAHAEIVLESDSKNVTRSARKKLRRGLASKAVCKIKPSK